MSSVPPPAGFKESMEKMRALTLDTSELSARGGGRPSTPRDRFLQRCQFESPAVVDRPPSPKPPECIRVIGNSAVINTKSFSASDIDLIGIALSGRTISSLTVEMADSFPFDRLEGIFPHIETLSITGTTTDVNLEPLASLRRLNKVHLSYCDGNFDSLSALYHLPSLHISNCTFATLPALPCKLQDLNVSLSPNLKEVQVRCEHLRTASFTHLAALEKIEIKQARVMSSLRVFGCNSLTSIHLGGATTSLNHFFLSTCDALEELDTLGIPHNLKSFVMESCKSLSKIGPFNTLAELTNLELSDLPLLEEAPKRLYTCTELLSLKISRCPGVEMPRKSWFPKITSFEKI